MDIVLKLLDKDKSKRLGSVNDIDDVISHPFFSSLNIEELKKKTLPAPYIPEITKDHIGTYFKLKTD